MTTYTIRKPEFLKGSEQARFYPGTLMTLVIALVVFAAYFVVSLIGGIVYGAAVSGQILSGNIDSATIQGLLIFSLYFEAALIACTLIYTRFIERRPLSTLGLNKQGFVLKYAAGFAAGIVLLAFTVLPAFLKVQLVYTGFQPVAIAFLGAFIVQSAAEEVLFRGYIMTSLMRRSGALWAVFISTVIFALIHIPFSSISALQFCGITLLGAVLALYMVRTNNLWGAMGLHASWNFFTAILTPVLIGPYEIGYAIFTAPEIPEDEPLLVVIEFSILLAAIALLLFAGRNRLVVKRTEEQIKLAKALGITKQAIAGDKAALSYAMRVSELAQGGEGKVAALLYHALSYGASLGYVKQEFGEDMVKAVDAMTVRYGEGPKEYWERVAQYPAALSAKRAETKLDEIKRPKSVASPGVWFAGGRVQCPMLRWGIEAEHCRQTAQAVDGAATAEEYINALDHDVCRRCPGRQFMGSIHRGASEFLQRYGEGQ